VTRLTGSESAPYFTTGGLPPRNLEVTYNGTLYHANDAGKITKGSSATDFCIPPAAYRPVAEGNADGVAADAEYVYALFNDGNGNSPYLIRCRTTGTPNLEVLFGDREAPIETPTAPFGVGGGLKDTGDALYWGVADTANGTVVIYRLVR
jgi:hypothetical protein